MLALILCIFLAPAQQPKVPPTTVAIILEGQEPVIIPTEVARQEYEILNGLQLSHKEDENLFHALTVALGVLPKPPLGLMPDARTRAQNKISEWKVMFKSLNEAPK
jgi:hypothetical protein